MFDPAQAWSCRKAHLQARGHDGRDGVHAPRGRGQAVGRRTSSSPWPWAFAPPRRSAWTGRTSTGARLGSHPARVPHVAIGRDGGVPLQERLSDRYLKLPRWALVRLRQVRVSAAAVACAGDCARLAPVYTQCKRFLKSIGLGRCSIEGLRHSWATLAIASGAAIADVSVAMGHTTTRMVIEHYMMSARAVSQACDGCGGQGDRRRVGGVCDGGVAFLRLEERHQTSGQDRLCVV